MDEQIELWSSNDLMELRQDDRMAPVPSFFLDTFFTDEYYSEDDSIKWANLPESDRFMAPFVLPSAQGKPLFNQRGETIEALRPGYIKLENAVNPADLQRVLPSEVFRNRGQRPSLSERFDMRVAELVGQHVRAINIREAWMAARAFIDGRVLIDFVNDQGNPNPSITLDFGRTPGLDTVKTSDFWNDPNADIIGDIERWAEAQYLAYRGGATTMLIVGAKVAACFKKNNGIKAALDTNYRGNDSVSFDLGVLRTDRPLKRLGYLDRGGIEVWTYKDTVDIPDGVGGKTKVDILNEKDVLMIAAGATGVKAYGAIMDTFAIQANLQNSRIYPRMFTDRSGHHVSHQSSPLPIPRYPNRVSKHRVLA